MIYNFVGIVLFNPVCISLVQLSNTGNVEQDHCPRSLCNHIMNTKRATFSAKCQVRNTAHYNTYFRGHLYNEIAVTQSLAGDYSLHRKVI